MKLGSKLGITLVLFLALLILLLSSCGDGDQVVVFPDPNLEAAICEAIGFSCVPDAAGAEWCVMP